MSDRGYLGVGMKFPPQVNPATGRIVVSSEEMSVKESVYLILTTNKTERLVRPNFGSRINSYTFMDVNYTMMNILIRDLSETILAQEPRISDVNIDIEDQSRQGRLIISIDYEIAATHQRDSLVYPYYLEKEDEITEEEFGQYETEMVNDESEDID